MDSELLELQRQFEEAQQAKSSVRLSERNVVELVNKLQMLELLDSDLLHTVSGKEYITQDRLRTEIEAEIQRLGRVSLIELGDLIGVDLYHIERQAENIVANNAELMLIQGEILSFQYWDSVAEEINERLQESSQISLAELAAQLQVSSELITSILQPRLGTIVQGKLEGGQLYTPSHVARIRAMIRGAVRGIMVPTNMTSVWNSLHQLLQQLDEGATGSSFEGTLFQTLLNGLVKDGEVLGSLRSGVSWTPAVFAHAQRVSVESFFSQNSFIGYDVLHKLAIPQPKQYLQSKYPQGISLETIFVHPSMISMLDAAAEDAIEHGGWLDCLSILPTSFGTQDAAKLLALCPSVQKALKIIMATVLAETCVVSNEFMKALFAQLEKDAEDFIRDKMASSQKIYKSQASISNSNKFGSESSHLEKVDLNSSRSSVFDGKETTEKGSKKKKGKEGNLTKVAIVDNIDETQESKGSKGKKKQTKAKGGNTLRTGVKSNQRKESEKAASEEFDLPSEEWILERFLKWHPDLEGTGSGQEDTNALVRSLVMHLRPMLVASWKTKKQAIVAANAESRRHVLDKLQQHLDEAYLNMQLFEKALDLFEDDPSTSVILHRHLLRTTATEIVDMVLLTLDFDRKLQTGDGEDVSQNIEFRSLNSGERTTLAKGLPGSLSTRVLEMVEALEGKRIEPFTAALGVAAKESGLWLKKLDKKIERTLLHIYRKVLASQIEAESDPIALLPKVVALLYVQVHSKALQVPGRVMAIAVSRLKDRLPETVYTTLMEYQKATVTLLTLLSAGSYSEDDCTEDRIMTRREFLESKIPELKALPNALSSGNIVAAGNS